jgi:spore maturation protein CgeB
MKILYFETKQDQLYYREFLNSLKKKCDVQVNEVSRPFDVVVYGYGWVCDENLDFALNSKLDVPGNPKQVLILNKEYKNMDKKIDFIHKNNIDMVFTPHHDYSIWEKQTSTKFYKLPFAANPQIFREWGLEKQYDLGFTGNLFNSEYYKSGIMGPEFNNIRERIANELIKPGFSGVSQYLGGNSYVHGEQYGKLINSSKVWLCTPSAIQLVGTRYYDVMGSRSLLFCKESDVYEGLFTPGEHCVTFRDDLSDFSEKLFYYLKNEDARQEIIDNASSRFVDNHTWDHRAEYFLEKIKNSLTSS